jgi:uncharacterized membrane protein YedE/YeeE
MNPKSSHGYRPPENRTPAGLPESGAPQLVLGLLFGIVFGFLLQKGGVGKYEVLIGMLLLRDFTVLKVMLSAVLVGMIGIYSLHAAGRVHLHVKPTRYGANLLGGIVFGIGFALSAYCPGTSAVALGQGNYDALAVIVGLMAGSYLFAELSRWLDQTVSHWGDHGALTLVDLIRIRASVVIPMMAAFVLLVLSAVHFLLDPTP